MPSLPAPELERLVIDEIAAICRDPQLAEAVVAEAMRQPEDRIVEIEGHLRTTQTMVLSGGTGKHPSRAAITHARAALRQFEPVWSELNPSERSKFLNLLIERIRVDGQAGTVSFVFRASGIAALAKRADAVDAGAA